MWTISLLFAILLTCQHGLVQASSPRILISPIFNSTTVVLVPTQNRTCLTNIQPCDSDLVVSENPLTWNLTGEDELSRLLNASDYQRLQWLRLLKYHNDTEWSPWTICAPCLDPLTVNSTFKLRFRLSDFVNRTTVSQVQLCPKSNLTCPEVDISYRGLWIYDTSLKTHMTLFDIPDVYPRQPYDTVEDIQYFSMYCSWLVKDAHLKYMALTNTACFGSNSSTILRRGLASGGSGRQFSLYIFPECPSSCALAGNSGLCLCNVSNSSISNGTEATAVCGTVNGFVLPAMYLPLALNHTDIDGAVWGLDWDRVYSSVWPSTYNCSSVSNNVINGSISCNTDGIPHLICVYNDTSQYERVPLAEISSCTTACGNGTLDEINYRFEPPLTEEDGVYIPRGWTESYQCNSQRCPWIGANGALISDKYPKWAGCWLNVSSSFQPYEVSSILDGDEETRERFVEKCAVASRRISNTFAIRKRLCYVANISLGNIVTTPSYDCAKFESISGKGFDIYRYSNDSMHPQWGPWSNDSCTKACDGGKIKRSRDCNNPPPPDSSAPKCNGSPNSDIDCNVDYKCPQPFSYHVIGCYSVTPTQVSETSHPLLDGYIPNGRKKAVQKCAMLAHLGNHSVFGLAYHGRCIIDSDLKCSYNYMQRSKDCSKRMGANEAMSVYTFNKKFSERFEGCESLNGMTTPFPSAQLRAQFDVMLDYGNISGSQANFDFQRIEQFVDENSEITLDYLVLVTKIFEVIADKLMVTSAAEAEEVITQVASTTQALTQDKFVDSWGESQAFTSLISSTETILIKLSGEIITYHHSTVKQNIYIMNVNDSSGRYKMEDLPQDVTISLPSEALLPNTPEPLAVVIYSNISDFIGKPIIEGEAENSTSENGSETRLGGTIVTVKLRSVVPTDRFSEEVRLRIPVNTDDIDTNTTFKTINLTCVFWNETSSSWSAEGCTTENTGQDAAECKCNHLTSFAVLIRFTDYEQGPKNSLALTVITYVGCGISLLCLIAALILLIYLDNLQTERKNIHMNLIVALGLAQITYLVGIRMTDDALTCKVIAILLHLLYTATFTWMLCEGIHLYHKIIAVFDTEGKLKRLLYYFIGWGFPTIIVAISVGVRYDEYASPKFCWLSMENGLVWAFIGPVCAIILINFCIMAMIIRVVVKSTSAVTPQEKKKLQVVKAGVKSIIILTPLLGINWVFGLLAVNETLLVFEFLFVTINSLQGLFIFLFHCVGSSEVRSAFLRKRARAARSADRSFEDKRKSKSNGEMWAKQSQNRGHNWPPSIFAKAPDSHNHEESSEADVVDAMLEGRIGRNLGGLKHAVKPPYTPDKDTEGVCNMAFKADYMVDETSSSDAELRPPGGDGKRYSSVSASTAMTSVGDLSSRRGSEYCGSREAASRPSYHSSESTISSTKSEHFISPSSLPHKGGRESGDTLELEDIEEFTKW